MRCIIELQFDLCKFKPQREFDQQRADMNEAFYCLKKIRQYLEHHSLYSSYPANKKHKFINLYKKRCRCALRKYKLQAQTTLQNTEKK